MASIYPIYFFINTALRSVVSASNTTSALSSLTLRRGDNLPVYAAMVDNPISNNTTWETISTAFSLKLTLKNDRDWDGAAVLAFNPLTATAGTSVLTGSTTLFYGNLDLSGITLSSLFSSTNKPDVTLQGEFEWIDQAAGVTYRNSTARFNLVVQNEIIKN